MKRKIDLSASLVVLIILSCNSIESTEVKRLKKKADEIECKMKYREAIGFNTYRIALKMNDTAKYNSVMNILNDTITPCYDCYKIWDTYHDSLLSEFQKKAEVK